ncbi:MAG TPA: RnfABCDGE type electron transport complex subunit D [Thermoanaerobaculia bacterium]|nr:RnfABCDGE type electron transport complex subunit D [Thermoanaerobaculia bacterium]HUM28979.1 RnfABCDGE type electron transport complex subunit D [Thermoanaerobaculia bacterium]HXK67089.1 RnfABCDGE type electron transport complex subunit D [Thermoanaerobaculia bacterium]
MSEPNYLSRTLLLSSPHARRKDSVPVIMYWVVGALLFPVAGSIYYFGWNATRLLAACILGCVITEVLFLLGRKKDLSACYDGSALITGILLALTLPPGLKTSYAVIGGIVAVGLGKQVFGGLGFNIFNPALVGRAFLQAAFPVAMTTWTPPRTLEVVDAVSFATPLGGFKFSGILTDPNSLLFGSIGGSLGETSALLLLIGGLILLMKGYIDWKIPAGIFVTVAIFTGILHSVNPDRYADPIFHLLAGGLMLGAIFMATDMVTSPLTPRGTWIYAVGIGILIVVIRVFGGLPEGVMYSILIMNGFVPLLNKLTRSRILGEGGAR